MEKRQYCENIPAEGIHIAVLEHPDHENSFKPQAQLSKYNRSPQNKAEISQTSVEGGSCQAPNNPNPLLRTFANVDYFSFITLEGGWKGEQLRNFVID